MRLHQIARPPALLVVAGLRAVFDMAIDGVPSPAHHVLLVRYRLKPCARVPHGGW